MTTRCFIVSEIYQQIFRFQPIGEGVTVSKAIKQVLHVSNPVFDLKNKSSKIEAVIDCLEKNVFVHKSKTKQSFAN